MTTSLHFKKRLLQLSVLSVLLVLQTHGQNKNFGGPPIRPLRGPPNNRPPFNRGPPTQPQAPNRNLPELDRPVRQNPPPQGPPPPPQVPEQPAENLPPYLVEGRDLLNFEIAENTPVNSVVYTLEGVDPEGSKVFYTISGDNFSIDRETGRIRLREPLDREAVDMLDVVITIQDENYRHIIPFRRTIKVIDVNDNAPEFLEAPFRFSVNETSKIGETLFTSLGVKDLDSGSNGVVTLSCVAEESPEACEAFDIQAREMGPGSYIGLVSLKKPLDFEARSSYDMVVRAIDTPADPSTALSSTANILIQVNDIQDQSPSFLNGPYSTTVPENTPAGTTIFDIAVRDGDTGKPRKIDLEIVGDFQNFFVLDILGHDEKGVLTAKLKKSEETVLDREIEAILSEGGLYAFQLRAREILEDESGFGDDIVTSNVTIVITDVDDQIPTFNRDNFTVAVPEDVGPDTPLPDLNIVVTDEDVGKNAEFDLVLENVENAEGVFTVYPTKGIGRTPVIVRVANAERLDYETDSGRSFQFKINALQGETVLSSAHVTVLVTDANDNSPIFEQKIYEFSVSEDAKAGELIGQITATDADSGRFGQVEYALRGFGAEKFRVNGETGEIFVNGCGESENGTSSGDSSDSCLDFESQKSFVLTYTGTDGGGQVTTVSVNVRIQDVNDNYPLFEKKQYRRVIEEDATEFRPQFFIKARDLDGPTQGGGQVFYSIKSVNTDATVFNIDPISGELTMIQPARSDLVDGGKYTIVIRATDGGKPPLHTDVKVSVDVGTVSNQKPVFLRPSYEGNVTEDAKPGTPVLQVAANDPDGKDDKLRFWLDAGAKDNFVINDTTGVISVAQDSVLDIQQNGDTYQIKVNVVDGGKPFPRTGETTVTILVEDVNDKSPKFEKDTYTMYVLESLTVGEAVVTMSAEDVDRNALLEYDIIEPISARDKTGNSLTNRAAYNYASAFSIDPRTGQIRVNEPLAYNSAAVIILTVKVTDKNAEGEKEQSDTAEVTFYIEAYKADSPQFASPWTPSDPNLEYQVKEQQPVGTVLFRLNAKDPITGQPVNQYEKISTSDPGNLIDVSPLTGEVINNQILDFETTKEVQFQVRARAGAQGQAEERFSDAVVTIKLVDINDNEPKFDQEEYSTEILESALPKSLVLTVRATDLDTGDFGKVTYRIVGEGSEVFTIHPEEGHIQVKSGLTGRSGLDREKQDHYELRVLALDMPTGGSEQKSSSTKVIVKVLDVNDTPPKFSRSRYSSVVPENSVEGTLVVQVVATDPDVGPSGEVVYDFADSKTKTSGLFKIDQQTGEIVTAIPLTGKGRQAPYVVVVRAIDKGVPELFTDTEVYVTIGDVSSNDGVPKFIRPEVNEVAYVPENSNPGTKVFQVEAYDPDDPESANGKLVYSLPDDGTIIKRLFQIDPVNGILSTKVKLDRENRANYTLILDVSDLGSPPQQTSRLLNVVVQDIDDHAPEFNRQKNSVPLELVVDEELPIGSQIGEVQAIDDDEGDNAIIDYAIIDGNDDRIFDIARGENNEGILSLTKRLDREFSGLHLLTIKCFRPYERNVMARRGKYDNTKLDEMQVKVIVADIDDNGPTFLAHNMTLGVRVNAPIYAEIATITAVDIDADAGPIHYHIENTTYYRPRTHEKEILDVPVFIIDETTGTLRTNQTYGEFADGYFVVVIKATNAPLQKDFTKVKVKSDLSWLKIFVLQDTDLMKFVFDSDPSTVQRNLPEFAEKIQDIFPQPLKFNIYDTEFYSKVDGSLDFGRTSSCFQIVEDSNNVVDLQSSERLLDPDTRPKQFDELLEKYSIISIERCGQISSKKKADWIEIFLLVIAALIGVLSFIAAIVVCCLYSRFKRRLNRNSPIKIIEAPVRAYIPASLPPGSIHTGYGQNPGGGGGLLHGTPSLYDWQESTIPMDVASYRSLPNN